MQVPVVVPRIRRLDWQQIVPYAIAVASAGFTLLHVYAAILGFSLLLIALTVGWELRTANTEPTLLSLSIEMLAGFFVALTAALAPVHPLIASLITIPVMVGAYEIGHYVFKR